VDEDGLVVVVLDLHRAQRARIVGDLDGVAVQDRAMAGLEPRPELLEGRLQRVDMCRRPGQGRQVGEASGDALCQVLQAGSALGVTGEEADALTEALEARGFEGVPRRSQMASPDVHSATSINPAQNWQSVKAGSFVSVMNGLR
jgi:hypothetical protein